MYVCVLTISSCQVKSLHEAELLAADERAAAKYVSAVEELREQLTQEKDKSLVRERELAQQKFDRQLDEEMKVWHDDILSIFLSFFLSFFPSFLFTMQCTTTSY